MELGLKGKAALVAAASQGLGRASAMALAREGVNLAICARREEPLKAMAEEIEARTNVKVHPVIADLSVYDDIRRFVYEGVKMLGRIDVLVTNAGGPRTGSFFELNDEDWLNAWNLTFMSVVRLIRESIHHMKRGGSIINLVSTSVKQPMDNLALSNAIRPAVVGLAKSLSLELAPLNIRVNNILPHFVLTDRIRYLLNEKAKKEGTRFEEVVEKVSKEIPLGRLAEPEEIGSLVAFLASDKASYITGVSIQVDGGAVKFIL